MSWQECFTTIGLFLFNAIFFLFHLISNNLNKIIKLNYKTQFSEVIDKLRKDIHMFKI